MSAGHCFKFLDLINIPSEVLLTCTDAGSGLDSATITLLKNAVVLKNELSYDGKEISGRVERFNRMEEVILMHTIQSITNHCCKGPPLHWRGKRW